MITKQEEASAIVEPSSRRRGLRVAIVVVLLLVVFALSGLFVATFGGQASHPCTTHPQATSGVPVCKLPS